MLEFKVNEYITLKLEDVKTNIYVNGELFNQCKYILMRKTVYELEDLLEDIESVDELTKHLESVEPESIDIPPETKFWVHCSNMQVWAENNYNTCLLHSNLSFPLLKKLSDIGDPLAKVIFKEEISKRLKDSHVIDYIVEEKYYLYLNQEELLDAVVHPDEVNAIMEISNLTGMEYTFFHPNVYKEDGKLFFYLDNEGLVHQIELLLSEECPYIPKELEKLEKLRELDVYIFDAKNVDFKLRSNNIVRLNLFIDCGTYIPDKFDFFPNLIYLRIRGEFKSSNKKVFFSSVPNSISVLKKLESLYIIGVNLENIPDSFRNLKKLKFVKIRNTHLKYVPNSFFKIKSISRLDLIANPELERPKKLPKNKKYFLQI